MEPQDSQVQSPFKIINGPQLLGGTILRVNSIGKLQCALHGPLVTWSFLDYTTVVSNFSDSTD